MFGELTPAGKNIAADAIAYDKAALHNAAPGDTGASNEISGGSYTRQNMTFAASAAGVRNGATLPTFEVPAGALVAFVSFWAGATCVGHQRLMSSHLAAAGHNSGGDTVSIKTANVHANTPTTGQLSIDGDAYEFSNRVGKDFTLVGTLTKNYAEDVEVLAPIPQSYDGGAGTYSLTAASMTIS